MSQLVERSGVGSPPFGAPRFTPVLARHRETRDTVTLELAADDDAPFEPGQFNMLGPFGEGEIAISISGSPGPGRLSHTVRAVGHVSNAVTSLQKGSMLGVRGPFGRPWPVAESEGKDIVVVAGGLGMAPLRPVVRAVLDARRNYGRFDLLYGARSPEDLVFARELEHWQASDDVEFGLTVDAAAAGWRGNVGVVTTLFRDLPVDPRRTVAMVCGPEIMMGFAVKALQERGVPTDAIWVSMERNMQCGAGVCGHCQLGGVLVCRDGPVFRFSELEPLFGRSEL